MPSKVKFALPSRAPKCHVRTGDRVMVIAGQAKGKIGLIIKVFPFEQRALVEGDAAIYDTKHVKPNPQANKEGGRQQKLRPVHLSNLALIDPKTNKPTRVRHERTAEGMVRVSKKSDHKFVAAVAPST
jgi:large subunit ribosomal protein L24